MGGDSCRRFRSCNRSFKGRFTAWNGRAGPLTGVGVVAGSSGEGGGGVGLPDGGGGGGGAAVLIGADLTY
jgi:hypothetical protein